MWDLGPGIEPASPALAGVFSATEPPGKPLDSLKQKSSFVFVMKPGPSINFRMMRPGQKMGTSAIVPPYSLDIFLQKAGKINRNSLPRLLWP